MKAADLPLAHERRPAGTLSRADVSERSTLQVRGHQRSSEVEKRPHDYVDYVKGLSDIQNQLTRNQLRKPVKKRGKMQADAVCKQTDIFSTIHVTRRK